MELPNDLECCKLCISSYKDGKSIKESIFNSEEKTDTQWFFIPKKSTFIFRGTHNITDVFYDLKVSKVERLHKGFFQCFVSIKEKLYSQIKECKGDEITFTGHSLGGALATISGNFASQITKKKIRVITFGSPRVGDNEFVKYFNNKVYYSRRYVTEKDLIPFLPSKCRFSHVKGLRLIKDETIIRNSGINKFKVFWYIISRPFRNSTHSIFIYEKKLDDIKNLALIIKK